MTLGGRLYAARRNAGMNLNLVASLWGENVYFEIWENDRSEPRIDKLVSLAGLLGLAQHIFWLRRA